MRRMTMYDSGKIFGGLAVFLIVIALPFYYSSAIGDPSHKPDPQITTTEKSCIESKEHMNAWHMDLLDDWRARLA